MPSRPAGLARQLDRAHVVLQPVAHVAVLRRDRAGDPGARLGGLHGGADLLEQLAVGAQAVQLEVAQDEVEIGRGRGAAHLVEVDEPLAAVGGLGRQGDVRQRVDDLGGQVQGVDQLVLGLARMDRHALDVDVRLVGREGLVDDLAELGAVQRVGDVGLQVSRQVAWTPRPISSSGVKQIRIGPWGRSGCSSRWRAMAMTMATPALSSAPSSVVPLAVTMSSPTFVAR